MKLTEILKEEQLDELSLAGLAAGAGKAVRGVGKAVGAARGAWQGAKDAYTSGRAAGYQSAAGYTSGTTPPPESKPWYKQPDLGVKSRVEPTDQQSQTAAPQQPEPQQTSQSTQSTAQQPTGQAKVNNQTVVRDFMSLTPNQQKAVLQTLKLTPKAAPAQTATPESINTDDSILNLVKKLST